MTRTRNKFLIDDHKIVIFGAGKIGRSFIGQLFNLSGYKVVFVDINKTVISDLNLKKGYNVVIKDNTGEKLLIVKNVRGVCLNDTDQVVRELADANIAALSVGQQNLPGTFPVIARSLVLRREMYGEIPLDFIIAENMRNSDKYIEAELSSLLPYDYPLKKLVGLVETSIGKMVPFMSQKDLEDDPLQVFAEPYNTLIVAKKGFRNPLPEVQNLDPKDNIKAWVDRKLFIHNLGHAAAAYLGFSKHPEATYVYEVLDDTEIFESTRNTMLQSADILMALYPNEFKIAQLEAHVNDLLHRFKNKALCDTIFRVGCDLYRKLSPEDRMVAPIKSAMAFNKPYDLILKALVSGIYFRARDENGNYLSSDEAFFREAETGIDHIIRNVCKLSLAIQIM